MSTSNRIAKIAMSSTCREYATGAAQSNTALMAVADFIAPTVNVSTSFFRYWTYDTANRFKIPKTKRAVGGKATQVKTGGVEQSAKLDPHALDYPIDEIEADASDEDLQDIVNEGSDVTAQLAALDWSKEVIDLALATVGAGTNLSAATAGMDFVDKIDEQIVAVMKAAMCGELCEARVLIGPTAMRRLKNHSSTLGRFVGSGKSDSTARIAVPTDEEVMTLFMGKPRFKVSWATYDAAGEGVAAVPTFMLDTAVLIFVCSPAPTRNDPSFMKTFRRRNKWMVPGKYDWEDSRGISLKYDWHGLPKVTNTGGVAVRLNLNA
jgi:hypothetical protein